MALNLGAGAGEPASEVRSAGLQEVQQGATTYLNAESEPLLPGGNFVFDASFSRHGSDLVLVGEDGDRVVVRGYFDQSEGLDLRTEDGHLFPHHLLEALAGPLAPGLYAEASGGSGSEEIGKVATIEGEVWAIRTDGVRELLGDGGSVFQGDILETAPDASLEIVFIDGMEFSMGGDTRISIDEMIYNPDESEGSSLLSVVKGSFIFVTGWIAGTDDDAMQVQTPSGTIGIRGTRVGCVVDSQGGNTVCSLLEDDGHVGKLAFTNATGTVLLTQLFETVVGISFDAELSTQTLSEIELRSLLGDVYDEAALETEAAPVVKSSGSVFIEPDFDFAGFEGLETLVAAGVLGEVTTLTPFDPPPNFELLDFVVLEEGLLQTPTSTLTLGEQAAALGQPLEGALGFVAGDTVDSTVTIGSLSVMSDGAPVVLSSGGDPVQFRLQDDGQTMIGFVPAGATGPQAGADIFALSVDASTGRFSFTLEAPLDHLDPNATGAADSLELSFDVIAEAGGLTVTTQIAVVVLDDGPNPVDQVAAPDFAVPVGDILPGGLPGSETEEGEPGAGLQASGLLIAIDVSTSMNTEITLANGETTTRLELTKLAAENLGRRFFEVGAQTGIDHRVSLVVFADGIEALSPAESFTDFATFAEAVRGVTDANGYGGIEDGTNFFGAVEAIDDVTQAQLLDQQSGPASNSIYFISDGFVNVGQPVSQSGWEDFLSENGIASIAVAVDPGDESVAALLEVNSPDGPEDPIILTAADDLADDFSASILPVSEGNVLTDAQDAALGLTASDDFGLDGLDQIVSLEVDGTTFLYDAQNDLITGGPGGPIAGAQLSVATQLGGLLDFDFISGDYRYQGASYDHPAERFTYGVADGDGDVATADLVVNPDSFVVSLTQHPAGSFIIAGFDPGSDRLEITDVIDSDQDGDRDLDDLAALGVTLSQDAVTRAVTLSLDADTSIVLDGIRDEVASLQELNEAATLVITG